MGVDIKALEQKIVSSAAQSELAQTIGSIPGFGKISRAELAGEIGTMARFDSEAGLAIYLGILPAYPLLASTTTKSALKGKRITKPFAF